MQSRAGVTASIGARRPLHADLRTPPATLLLAVACPRTLWLRAGCVTLPMFSDATVAITAASLVLLPCCLRRSGRVIGPLRSTLTTMTTIEQQLGRYVDSVSEAATALRDGQLVAFPTETVYGLGAHAFDAEACARVFVVKGRPCTDPLIVQVPSARVANPGVD